MSTSRTPDPYSTTITSTEKVGVDHFEYKKSSYVIIVDYFLAILKYVAKLTSTSSPAVITQMKSIFARHGIASSVMSDNRPQFLATVFSSFAKEHGFIHYTSSPMYPQANGQVERGVRGSLLGITCLSQYPTSCIYSPVQLMI